MRYPCWYAALRPAGLPQLLDVLIRARAIGDRLAVRAHPAGIMTRLADSDSCRGRLLTACHRRKWWSAGSAMSTHPRARLLAEIVLGRKDHVRRRIQNPAHQLQQVGFDLSAELRRRPRWPAAAPYRVVPRPARPGGTRLARCTERRTVGAGSVAIRASPASSERELGRQLDEARRRGGDDLAERRARDVAVDRAGAVELRVVEDVERLEPQLEASRLCRTSAA